MKGAPGPLGDRGHLTMNNILENVVQELWHALPSSATPRQRAKTIYDWVAQNIEYDYDRLKAVNAGTERPVLHPGEVLEKRKGICSDMAYLYVTLSRQFGLQAQYARVTTKDHNGKTAYHACAIVMLDGKGVQVDPTHKIFEAHHQEYCIEEPVVGEPQAVQQEYSGSWQESYRAPEPAVHRLQKLGRKLAALALCAGLFFGARSCWELRKHQNVQYCETKDEARFTTKNGEMRYAVNPEAAQPWKETLFFAEAIKGDLSDHELLEVYVRADANKDSTINPAEAGMARDFARAMYLKSKQ